MNQEENQSLYKIFIILITAVLFSMISSCSRNQETDSQTQQDSLSLRLKWVIYSSFAQHFVAKERGLYSDENLSVEILPGGIGLDPIKLVAAGQNDVGLASYAQILLAQEKDIPVVAIAEEYVKTGSVIISLQSSGIVHPKDLIGKTVGIIPGSDTGTVYEALMAKLGIDRSQIREIPTGFDLSPFFHQDIDATSAAFITNQPIVAEQKGYPVNIIDPSEYGIQPGGNVFFVREDSLLDMRRREVIKRFLRASVKAILMAQEMPDGDVVDIVLKYNGLLNRDTELAVWRATKEHLLEDDPKKVGLMSRERWQHTAELFNQADVLKAIPSIDDCYTNDLIEEILTEGLK